jgi:hypothetical protein
MISRPARRARFTSDFVRLVGARVIRIPGVFEGSLWACRGVIVNAEIFAGLC